MVDAPMAFSIFPLTLGIALSLARSLAVSGGGAVVVGAKVVGAAVVLVAWLSAVDSLVSPPHPLTSWTRKTRRAVERMRLAGVCRGPLQRCNAARVACYAT